MMRSLSSFTIPSSPQQLMVQPSSSTQVVFQQMLDNVQSGVWETGQFIPSERSLIEQFGVSRIAIREALSMLRGLGILDISHGRRTKVKAIDSSTFGHLLPLILANERQRSFQQVFEMRLAIEPHAAAKAATQRTDSQLIRLGQLIDDFRNALAAGSDLDAPKFDLEFHLEIARASANPLFPVLLEALGGFVSFTQQESCRDDPVRSQRAVFAHESILDAIRSSDPDRARVEMETHLRYSMSRRIKAKTNVLEDPESLSSLESN